METKEYTIRPSCLTKVERIFSRTGLNWSETHDKAGQVRSTDCQITKVRKRNRDTLSNNMRL